MVAEYAIVNGRTITVDVAFNPMPVPVYYMYLLGCLIALVAFTVVR
jgi:hypothetical protein